MTTAILTSTAPSGHINYRMPTLPNAAVAGVGCSGSDPIWNNGGIAWLVGQVTGTTPAFAKSTTPGAPIGFHISNPNPAFGVNVWDNMELYSVIHLGDNPGIDNLQTPFYLNQWTQKFWDEGNGGAGGEILLWSLQLVYSTNPESMNVRYEQFQQKYNEAQDYCNARRPENKPLCRQIPGLQLFRLMYEDQEAGLSPGASPTWFADLYSDAFHMIDGKIAYIASMIGAACMYGIDPFDMPNDMQTASGFTVPEAAYVKSCVSDTIKNFSRAGVDTSGWA